MFCSYFFRRVFRDVELVGTAATISASLLRSRKSNRIKKRFFYELYLPLSKFVSILISKATRSAFRAPFGIFSPCVFNRFLSSATVNPSI